MLEAWMSDNKTKTWSEDSGLSTARKTELRSDIKTSPYEALFGTAQRIGFADFPVTEDMYSSIETEEELKQLFNAGMKNGRNKEEKEEANRQSRKDEDENQTNEALEETIDKKNDKKN